MASDGSGAPRSADGDAAHRGPEPGQRPPLPITLLEHLGTRLRSLYGEVLASAPPPHLLDLVDRLDAALARTAPAATSFRDDLLAALPSLRAFALSLAANPAKADDLVQETLLKAWQSQHRFRPGTNFTAWLFTILRNSFYSDHRKRRREVEDVDGTAASRLITLPDQVDRIELQDVWGKLAKVPARQREAMLLVGPHGMTYEAAAEILGCQVGTVKSRVSRGRACLSELMGFADGRLGRSSA